MEGKPKAAIVGATGYTGAEVARLLLSHPFVELSSVTSERSSGRLLRDECPWLDSGLVLSPFDPDSLEADIAFLCLPNGRAMCDAPALARRMKVVDLSGDFRLSDTGLYSSWYGFEHTSPGLSPWPVYGLPELVDRASISSAQIVANPGCYVTATLLALVPLARAGLIAGVPVVDAKSGVSGAGRSKVEAEHLLSELHGSTVPYKTTGHRHIPEIEQLLGTPVRFTPHLLPISRGICATIYVPVQRGVDKSVLVSCLDGAYGGEAFVRRQETPPSTKQVHGSNLCVLFADYDERTGHAVLVSVIDNLVKGAAGQAVQNMNLMLGLPETSGLPLSGVWP